MTDTLAIELYKQALTYAYSVVGAGGDELSTYQRGAVSAGKYAELIVAECAKVCRDHGASAEHSYTLAKATVARRTAEGCATLIERKFKIEVN